MIIHDRYHVDVGGAYDNMKSLMPIGAQTMKRFIVILCIVAATTGATFAQTTDQSKMNHSMMRHQSGSAIDMPTESGQSAFAAIQEIVTLLESDPGTDWSKVNLEALRQHLIDMNNVTLGADVQTANNGKVTSFTVTGEGRVRDSIQRMVKAHAETTQGVEGWTYTAQMTDTGATLAVTPPSEATARMLAGLGFIGIMARGMHHQEHHFMIATGMSPHQ
jgi:hypothetical protein